MRKGNVVAIDNDWWKQERRPSESLEIIPKRRERLPAEKLYPLSYFADQLSVGKDVLYDACRADELQHEMVGRRYRVAASWVQQWLEYCRTTKRRRG